jgi:hypothetical protein
LCPYRAAEVWLPQQDTPLFLNSSRTQVLTIPRVAPEHSEIELLSEFDDFKDEDMTAEFLLAVPLSCFAEKHSRILHYYTVEN